MEFENCPHCGSAVELADIPGAMRNWPEIGVKCTGCGITFTMGYDEFAGKKKPTLELVRQIWNRRPKEKEQGDRAEGLGTRAGQVLAVKGAIEEWASKQGHDRCWYYPDIFMRIAQIVEAKIDFPKGLPPRPEFRKGCERFEDGEYKDCPTP